jgi:hypothetical protein
MLTVDFCSATDDPQLWMLTSVNNTNDDNNKWKQQDVVAVPNAFSTWHISHYITPKYPNTEALPSNLQVGGVKW